MALPIIFTRALAAANATALVNAQGTTVAGTAFTLGTTVLDAQRRLLFNFSANESSNTFRVIGTNDAGFAIAETVSGVNASTTQSNLDFKTVSSITPVGTTAGTTSVGTNGSGSSLWQIVNWHVTPANFSFATILVSGTATWSIQYTYDDPNNLSSGVTYPQPFTHPTVANATTTVDGVTNDPITAWRLLTTAGVGTVRAIGIQAGISGP